MDTGEIDNWVIANILCKGGVWLSGTRLSISGSSNDWEIAGERLMGLCLEKP